MKINRPLPGILSLRNNRGPNIDLGEYQGCIQIIRVNLLILASA